MLCTQSFPNLRCIWDRDRTSAYTTYKPLWAHKYYSHYREVCEHFIMPLYTMIFLKECNCRSEEALKFIEEYADYYLTEDEMYIRMYGYSREPSLLPKYATDYVVHKEAARQVFLDGIGSFLFKHKKETYPPIPFILGSYKSSKVKKDDEFLQELEQFHFGEMNFHTNDSQNKVVEHCKEANVHFEYTNHWDKDEETFRNAKNMTKLKRRSLLKVVRAKLSRIELMKRRPGKEKKILGD